MACDTNPLFLLILFFFDPLPAPFSPSGDTFLIDFVRVHSCLMNEKGQLWMPLCVFSLTLF